MNRRKRQKFAPLTQVPKALKTAFQKAMSNGHNLLKRAKSHRYWTLGLATIGAITFLLLATSVCMPQTIHAAYTKSETCTFSPKLFPDLFHTSTSGAFRLTRHANLSLGDVSLYASSICAAPQHAPKANARETYAERWGLIGKTFHVTTTAYPSIADLQLMGAKPVPLSKPINFHLATADATFSYALTSNGHNAPCKKAGTVLNCGLTQLKLGYAQTYPVALVRTFGGDVVDTIVTKQVQTISATAVVETSIAPQGVVYEQPQQITLQTNKPLAALSETNLTLKNSDGTSTVVPTTSSYADTTITFKLANPLPRKAELTLHIGSADATDGSTLEAPYDLPFTTSGGPKVTGSNLGSSGLGFDTTLAVSFDQALLPTQNAGDAVTLLVNDVKQPATVAIVGQKLQIKAANSFPVCAHITLKLSNVLQNNYGVSGDSEQSFATRAQCYTTFSIGTSVKGRPMTAYRFGSGASMVLYVGATHGSESNSGAILQKWITALIASPDNIPADRTIVVIPQINPDGVAANNRLNANAIDLNRNFPADNWQSVVTEPGGASSGAGGPSPLSEPESRALANFVLANRPRFVLTYHSQAAIVEANESGDSFSLAAQYAAMAKYQAISTRQIGSTFDYSTTGAFEDWMNDKLGLAAFVIELQSSTADEFSRNEAAMWFMVHIGL